jgi:Integrase core domain
VIKGPVRAPKARAHAERWVGSVRRECLDRLLILGRRHLHHVLTTYALYYNEHRPHRALAQRPPLSADQPLADVIDLDRLRRRDLLGGLIHEYHLRRSPDSTARSRRRPRDIRAWLKLKSRIAIRHLAPGRGRSLDVA